MKPIGITRVLTHGLLASLVLAGSAARARAHDGPPYPILVDQAAGPLAVSVWADPDVGVGTFYFYLEPADGGPLPETDVDVYVRPRDRQREEARFTARPGGKRDNFERIAEVDFDSREWWNVRFVFTTPRGGGELATIVEVTPPGLGRLDLLWYLAPFLAVAFLWAKAILRRRAGCPRGAQERAAASPVCEPATPDPSGSDPA